MANPNYKNILDDTGRELVNVLRRIVGKLSGNTPEMEKINYVDNNFNLLDSTGKKMVEALAEIEHHMGNGEGGNISLATEDTSGLMSAEDKRKLDAFEDASSYVTGVDPDVVFLSAPEELPETGRADVLYVMASPFGLYRYDISWERLGELDESDVLAIIREEEGEP